MRSFTIVLFTAAASVASLTSCNERARLAKDIDGSWVGVAERVTTDDKDATVTVTREFTFTTDAQDKSSGTVMASAPFTVMTPTPLLGADVQPISVTASGNAYISGTWRAIDDDEISVSFDPASLEVNVDTDAVYLEYNVISQTSAPDVETLRPAYVAAVQALVKRNFPAKVFNYNKIDDIKIKGTLMNCEIHDRDYSFHRDN